MHSGESLRYAAFGVTALEPAECASFYAEEN